MIDTQRINCSIVTYNTSVTEVRQVLTCLQASRVVRSIVIVDNSPTDRLRVDLPDGVDYVHRPDNPGYGTGHNVAIQQTLSDDGAEFHLVINPDVHFSGDVLLHLTEYLDRHPQWGLVMPKVVNPDGTPQHLCKLLPTPLDLFGRRFFGSWFEGTKQARRYAFLDYQYDRPIEVPYLSGCFMLIRKNTLRRVGGFDERFFMYLEDVDLSRRLGEVSATYCVPSAVIVHAYGAGSYRSMKLLRFHIRSAVQYFNKWGWFFDAKRKAANRRSLEQLSR